MSIFFTGCKRDEVFFFHILAQFYSDLSVAPDWHLGLLFGLGRVLGMYLGERTQKCRAGLYFL